MATLTQDVKQLVQEKAKAIRVSIVQSVTAAKSGHPGGSLSFLKVMQRLHYMLHWLKKVTFLKMNF